MFRSAQAIEIILTEGDVLYVPSFWIHYIVSLTHTVQCNGRMIISHSKNEGKKYGGYEDVRNCGKQAESEAFANRNMNYPDVDFLNMNI